MDDLDKYSNLARRTSLNVSERSKEMDGKIHRARRKSRELERELFGCLMQDMENMREAFDKVDIDKSGSIDEDELMIALKNVGKELTKQGAGAVDLRAQGPAAITLCGRHLGATPRSQNARR